MSKGYTATYMRKLLRGHKAPLIERIEQLEAQILSQETMQQANQLLHQEIEQLETQNINCNTLIDKLNERIEQLETPTYRSEWGDLAKLHEEFKQHIAKQAKIIAAVEAVLIDHKGFHYGDNAVSVLCALEDALKGTCNVQNIR